MPDMDELEDNFRGLLETRRQLERVDEELEKTVKEMDHQIQLKLDISNLPGGFQIPADERRQAGR